MVERVCRASWMLKRQGSDKSANPINKPFISGKNVTIANPPEMDANQGPPLARSFIYGEKIRDSAGERIRRSPNTIHYEEDGEEKGLQRSFQQSGWCWCCHTTLMAISRSILDYPGYHWLFWKLREDETKRWRVGLRFQSVTERFEIKSIPQSKYVFRTCMWTLL